MERVRVKLLTPFDKILLTVFLLSFVVAIVGMQLIRMSGLSIFVSAISASAPLAFVGITYCLMYRKHGILILLSVLVLALLFLSFDINWIVAIVMIVTGLTGVLALVNVLQKAIFYPVVASIEYLNVKRKLSLRDRLISFLFSISGDIDTRNIDIDSNVNRASVPWSEVASTLRLSFLAGLFIWIYISMNPSWMSFDSFSNVPVYLFSLMLYIPLIVMPFSVFLSLNVRINTKYRDFLIYDGVKMTLYKMVVPVFAAFVYILLAVNDNGFEDVGYFILLSIVFNLLINILACIIFYRWFEGDVVNEIRSKWSTFHPVSMTMVIDDEKPIVKENVPGTPRRDLSDLGVMVFDDSHE